MGKFGRVFILIEFYRNSVPNVVTGIRHLRSPSTGAAGIF
jgi:hypothetical protein